MTSSEVEENENMVFKVRLPDMSIIEETGMVVNKKNLRCGTPCIEVKFSLGVKTYVLGRKDF